MGTGVRVSHVVRQWRERGSADERLSDEYAGARAAEVRIAVWKRAPRVRVHASMGHRAVWVGVGGCKVWPGAWGSVAMSRGSCCRPHAPGGLCQCVGMRVFMGLRVGVHMRAVGGGSLRHRRCRRHRRLFRLIRLTRLTRISCPGRPGCPPTLSWSRSTRW